jgi:hypothetical protein
MRKARMTEEEFWALFEKTSGCWEWQGPRTTGYGGGYGIVPVNDFGSNQAHRVSYILTHGPIPPKMRVCHSCDNKPCGKPDHLFAGTGSVNTIDIYSKDRPSAARLTTTDVRVIRREIAADAVTVAELAARYEVSESTIRNVIHRRTWNFI